MGAVACMFTCLPEHVAQRSLERCCCACSTTPASRLRVDMRTAFIQGPDMHATQWNTHIGLLHGDVDRKFFPSDRCSAVL